MANTFTLTRGLAKEGGELLRSGSRDVYNTAADIRRKKAQEARDLAAERKAKALKMMFMFASIALGVITIFLTVVKRKSTPRKRKKR